MPIVRVPFLILALAAMPLAAQQPAPPAVTLQPFGQLAIHPQREAPATAISLNESRIAAEVTASIESMAAEAGQVVARGAVLARLDARDHELAVARARAASESALARQSLAEAQLRRARELKAQGFISQEALNQRETEVAVVTAETKSARAALDTARRNLEKCVIRAPFRAIVRSRSGQVGELAVAGSPLYVLVDADRIEVSAQVPARGADTLARAEAIEFVSQSGRHAVRLERISPAVERAARTREARLAFVRDKALSGTEGRIVWRDPIAHVPAELIVRRGKELGVFVADEGKARFHVLPEAQEGRPAALDLPVATQIVVSGRHGLADGQAVQVPQR